MFPDPLQGAYGNTLHAVSAHANALPDLINSIRAVVTESLLYHDKGVLKALIWAGAPL